MIACESSMETPLTSGAGSGSSALSDSRDMATLKAGLTQGSAEPTRGHRLHFWRLRRLPRGRGRCEGARCTARLAGSDAARGTSDGRPNLRAGRPQIASHLKSSPSSRLPRGKLLASNSSIGRRGRDSRPREAPDRPRACFKQPALAPLRARCSCWPAACACARPGPRRAAACTPRVPSPLALCCCASRRLLPRHATRMSAARAASTRCRRQQQAVLVATGLGLARARRMALADGGEPATASCASVTDAGPSRATSTGRPPSARRCGQLEQERRQTVPCCWACAAMRDWGGQQRGRWRSNSSCTLR